MKKNKTSDAIEILDRRHPPTADELKLRGDFSHQMEIAELIYKARTRAGLSQRDLARRVGTTASVICRLEDAEYDGHSLGMLRRIAEALGKRVELKFVPAA
jgi:ribosome-binding protein aMBF1 (putative translation factor)